MEYTVVIAVLYFVPTVVAHVRWHRNKNAITVMNLFLGWTFIGWVAALVWASTSNTENESKSGGGWKQSTPAQDKQMPAWQSREPSRSAPPPQFENESDTEYLARLRRIGMIGKK